MPELLDEWPVPPSPFDDILDGSIWKIRADEYPAYKDANGIRIAIQSHGKKKGATKVRTIKLAEDVLAIQAIYPKAKKDEVDPRRGTRLRAVER